MNICFKRCGTLYWLLNRKHKQASQYGLGALWLPLLERGCAEHVIRLLCRVGLFKSNKILEFEETPVCDLRPEAWQKCKFTSLTSPPEPESLRVNAGVCSLQLSQVTPMCTEVWDFSDITEHHRTYTKSAEGHLLSSKGQWKKNFFFFSFERKLLSIELISVSLNLSSNSTCLESHKQVQSVFPCWDVR